ncbi:hypothetical protein [uncultured Pseudodesulfovibrio sp.]|uniref:hypothetical protein n=1 Tax=uncultured Pseudodesulfovibrio sp. TaxID=2035858 RepID=UPI0029C61447|nr:hypothetical protein [uncultured Pseudodesulfovibrio sp.]
MNGLIILQAVFFLGGLAVLILAWLMRSINRERRIPGVSWWVPGYAAMGLASIGTGADFYYGDWIKGFVTHLLLTGGIVLVWVGTRIFFEGRVDGTTVTVSTVLLTGQAVGVFWFYFITPTYQARLTITCVVLLILSMSLSMSLFLSRADDRAVIAAGISYSLFALLNGLRTISILISPVAFAHYLSGPLAVAATVLMLPTLLAAQIATLVLVRSIALRGEK